VYHIDELGVIYDETGSVILLEDVPESELVRFAQTDPQHFGLIYQRFVRRIYNYVYYRTGNAHDAEDLTARAFIRAMNHMPFYKDRGTPFSAWLYRIAHNLMANWHRDNSRRQIMSLEAHHGHPAQQADPESMAETREEQEQLLQAIRTLPDERQQLLILKFVEKLSNAEIGAIMGRTEGAVKSLYHRTLLTLREQMIQNETVVQLLAEETKN
jgi:RNA polymerase sigma-70 factor (ECF subfamily)